MFSNRWPLLNARAKADTWMCSRVYQQSPTAYGGVTTADFLGGLAPPSSRRASRGPLTARLPASESADTGSAELGHTSEKQTPLALLTATLKFNEISFEDGYVEADRDEDGKVSESDLRQFGKDIQLGCSDDEMRALYTSLDPHGHGCIERDVWIRALTVESTKPGVATARSGASTAREHSVCASGACVSCVSGCPHGSECSIWCIGA